MRLYGYWRSSASWRVRIGLHLKGLSFETVPVHLVRGGGEQHGEPHRARNPMEQVPVLELEHEGRTVQLAQSLAILAYVDERWPTPPLLPADALARARVRQLAETVNAGIQPLQNLHVMQRLKALGVDANAWSREVIARGLAALEAGVVGSGAPFMVGDQPGLADICLVPQLYNARRFDVDLAPFPTLLRVEASCARLPAFQAAHPDAQPDAVSP